MRINQKVRMSFEGRQRINWQVESQQEGLSSWISASGWIFLLCCSTDLNLWNLIGREVRRLFPVPSDIFSVCLQTARTNLFFGASGQQKKQQHEMQFKSDLSLFLELVFIPNQISLLMLWLLTSHRQIQSDGNASERLSRVLAAATFGLHLCWDPWG